MSTTTLQLHPRYTRSEPQGRIPAGADFPDPATNRLYPFWRPIIDMQDSEFAATRLRTIPPVAAWLAEPDAQQPLWFARLNVPGLRHQVIRHSGLRDHDARTPQDLKPESRTPAWNTLLAAMADFPRLDAYRRSLVMFLLGQLSYCDAAIRLAGEVETGADPAHNRYVYQVARVHGRRPGHQPVVLPLFHQLAKQTADPQLALLAAFQGISHAVRKDRDLETAQRFEELGTAVPDLPDDWHTALVRSRFHRSLALLRMHQRRHDDMRREMAAAFQAHTEASRGDFGAIDQMVIAENRRILLESRINAAARARGAESAEEIAEDCEEILSLDPHCALVRLAAGDGYAAAGWFESAARWFSRAGELGTGAGAIGWYRAGQCYDFLGDRGSALDAMGRCLELDASAVEPRRYLAEAANATTATTLTALTTATTAMATTAATVAAS